MEWKKLERGDGYCVPRWEGRPTGCSEPNAEYNDVWHLEQHWGRTVGTHEFDATFSCVCCCRRIDAIPPFKIEFFNSTITERLQQTFAYNNP
jgi:hypothetical protein